MKLEANSSFKCQTNDAQFYYFKARIHEDFSRFFYFFFCLSSCNCGFPSRAGRKRDRWKGGGEITDSCYGPGRRHRACVDIFPGICSLALHGPVAAKAVEKGGGSDLSLSTFRYSPRESLLISRPQSKPMETISKLFFLATPPPLRGVFFLFLFNPVDLFLFPPLEEE